MYRRISTTATVVGINNERILKDRKFDSLEMLIIDETDVTN